MFLVSHPELVIAQCRAGIPGAFPTLNARPVKVLDEWLDHVRQELHSSPGAAPFGVNLIVHKSNPRLIDDTELVINHRVPFVVTSVGNPIDVVNRVHGYGGLVFHDVTTIGYARKAIDAGVDGLVLVCAGAGGHAGTLSPFALVEEARAIFDGTIILAGAVSTGRHIRAAEVLGADLVYMGTRFIATAEAHAPERYKRMIIESTAADVLYTPYFSGAPANYLVASIIAAGFNPYEVLSRRPDATLDFGYRKEGDARPWRDVWSAGQGVGAIDQILSVAELVRHLKKEYVAAL
jgi:nitronate monooxygenase